MRNKKQKIVLYLLRFLSVVVISLVIISPVVVTKYLEKNILEASRVKLSMLEDLDRENIKRIEHLTIKKEIARAIKDEVYSENVVVARIKKEGTIEVYGSKNKDVSKNIASLSKIVLANVIHEKVAEEKELGYETCLPKISLSSFAKEGDVGLRPGAQFTIRDSLDMLLLSSSNDLAHFLSVSLFGSEDEAVAKMNNYSQKRGLSSTFKTASGYDMGVVSLGNYATAEDISRLVASSPETNFEFLNNNLLKSGHVTTLDRKTFNNCATGKPYPLESTVPEWYISSLQKNLIFSKTGYTNLAGGAHTTIVRFPDNENGDLYSIVVLGSTFTKRFKDTHTLTKALDRAYATIKLINI